MKPAVSLASRSCRAVAPVEPAAAAIASRPTHTALPLRADPAYHDTMSWNDDDLGPDASGWSEEPAQLWTPTSTNQEIAGRMRDLRGLRVRGEVSQPRASSGHLYFELKDERSRLRAPVVLPQPLERAVRCERERGQRGEGVVAGRVANVNEHARQGDPAR